MSNRVNLVLAHSSAQNVHDLLTSIFAADDEFIIHVDKKSPATLHKFVEDVASKFDNVHKLESLLCSWGGFSLVQVVLNAIVYATAHCSGWSHLVVLSEQHVALRTPSEIDRQLENLDVWTDGKLVASLDKSAQEDIYARTNSSYRELPGVGCFRNGRSSASVGFRERLFHGSQWIILGREVCARLISGAEPRELRSIFKATVLSDETCLPTMLLATTVSEGQRVFYHNATFVAWPHLSGSPDMFFSAENVLQALDGKYLYIRKRPKVLAPELITKINGFSEFGLRYAVPLDLVSEPTTTDYRHESFVSSLQENFFTCKITVFLKSEYLSCPAFYAQIEINDTGGRLSLNILSENFQDFKIVLCLHGERIQFSDIKKDGYATSLIRARIHSLAFSREIHVDEDSTWGFFKVSSASFDQGHLDLMKLYLNHGRLIASGRAG